MATQTVEAGILVCGQIRDYLNRLKFMGWKDVEYLESSGIIQRTFTIRSTYEHAKIIRKDIGDWAEKLK